MSKRPGVLLAMLFLISVFNYLDRQVMAILQEPIRHELHLTDTQLGALSLSFGLVYALFALPIGRLADQISRKRILLFSVAAWSMVTIATAFAASFPALLVARMSVSIGEAGVNPTAHSMIADTFPPEKRPLAVSVFAIGIPIGIMLTIALGGLIAEAVGWRNTFLCFGIPGFILAVIFQFGVAEPARGGSDGISHARPALPLRPTLLRLARSRSFMLVATGATCQAMAGFSVAYWIPSYYIRAYGLPTGTVALYVGPIFGIGGLIGMLLSAALASWLSRRDIRWQSWVPAISSLCASAIFIGVLFAPSFEASVALLFFFTVFANSFVGITDALVQSVVPLAMRGLAAAVKTSMLNLVGFGLGTQLTGALSDAFNTATDGEGLRYALSAITLGAVVAVILYLLSARHLVTDLESALRESR